MRRITLLVLVLAFAVSTLWGQELPSGVAGEHGMEFRALAHRVAPTRVPVTWSGCGTATVDGILSPLEWNTASHHPITINTAAGAVTGTLYVMHDNLTLYVALQFPESAPQQGSLAVEFDNDNDGVPFEAGDDAIVYNNTAGFFDDFRTPCGTGICAPEDTSSLGTTEGRGAYANDGSNSVYEISHPYNDGDHAHDILSFFNTGVGGVAFNLPVGFYIMLRTIDSGGAIHDTFYPDVAVYDQIEFQSCPVDVFSGCGTPIIDGRIGLTEWARAPRTRLSVNTTPSGDTVPGTLYLLNDSFNLYLGLDFDVAPLAAFNQLDLHFESGAGTWLDDDYLSFNPTGGGFRDQVGVPCIGFPLVTPPCVSPDIAVGGRTDGTAALRSNGVRSAYELAHPLYSGDPNDIALSFGASVPYDLFLTISGGVTFLPSVLHGGLPRWRVCTPSPAPAVSDMSQQVDALETSGGLSAKNAETLSKDLTKANENLQSGKSKQAANDLGNFVNDVTKMMRKGELADRFGQPLIAAANAAISQL